MVSIIISVIIPISIIVTLVVVVVPVVVAVVWPVSVSVIELPIIMPISSVIIVWPVIIVSIAAPRLLLSLVFECFSAILLIVSLFVRAIRVVAGVPTLIVLLPLSPLVSSPPTSSSFPSSAPAIDLIIVLISTLISRPIVTTTLIRTVGLLLLETSWLTIAPSRTRGFLFLLSLLFLFILARWLPIAAIATSLLGRLGLFGC